MGKLMYTNRKSEGVKLGQIVAKDLRKRNKPSTTSKSSDTNKDTSLLELQLNGKNLTDDGLIEVANGFEEVLVSTDGVFHTKLQIVNISGNNLTVRALAVLSMSLRAAANDLEDLDISDNNISVATPEDALQWEIFLMALENCNKLRRLNLEGNHLEGSLPFEIFARSYARQCRRNDNARWTSSSSGNIFEAVSKLSNGVQNLDVDSSEILLRRLGNRGLPSINNIILANTGMTDQGALFLTDVLEHHIGGIDDDDEGCGIEFMPNEQLGPIGMKILKHASNVYDDFPETAVPAATENVLRPEIPSIIPSSRRSSHSQHHRRKTSTLSSATEETSHSSCLRNQITEEDYESLRRKIQRGIIEEKGAQSVKAWGVSLKLLSYARILVDNDPSQRSWKDLQTPETSPRQNRSLSGVHLTAHVMPAPTYASKLSLNTEITTKIVAPSTSSLRNPVTPQIFRQPAGRRESSSNDTISPGWSLRTDYSSRSSTLASSVDVTPYMTDQTPVRFVGALPENVWAKVFSNLADPAGLLTEEQRHRIISFAKDRATLASEAEVLGKPSSVQIWKVLDAMGSLANDVAM